MAITNTNVTVNGTPGAVVQLHAGHKGSVNDPCPVSIYNPGVATVYVGSSVVTTSNGIPIAPGATSNFTLVDGDILYGITATVTTTINVMRGRS